MIISQIHAQNILRYTKLALQDLPPAGTIGISGPNESGKTSIVEIIGLALFGRTSTVESSDLTKIVKWGQFDGLIRLEFTARDGNSYTVSRQFDRDGTQSAQLFQTGSQTPMARGVEAVDESIVQLGGFTYQRFIDSFYLAQRTIIAPEVLKETVKVLSGVQTLENISTECEADIRSAQEALIPLEPKMNAAQKQLVDLNIQDQTLSDLQNQRQESLDQISHAELEISQRQSASSALQAAYQKVAEQVQQIGTTEVQSSLANWNQKAGQLKEAVANLEQTGQQVQAEALVSGVSSWLDDFQSTLRAFTPVQETADARRGHQAWLLGAGDRPGGISDDSLRPLPDRKASLNEQLARAVSKRTQMGTGFAVLLVATFIALLFVGHAPAAILLGCIAFVFFTLTTLRASDVVSCKQEIARLDHEADSVRQEVCTLDTLADLPLPDQLVALQGIDDDALSASAASFANRAGAVLLNTDALTAQVDALNNGVAESEKAVQKTLQRLKSEVLECRSRMAASKQQCESLEQSIRQEEARREAAGQLKQHIAEIESERSELLNQIAVRRAAQQLLEGCYPRLFGRFDLEMQSVASQIMPLLTEDRYQSLRIGEDLDIQAFSKEKGDFVNLSEVSGGTYFQLMLAIRLALSQALISSTVDSQEFIILDEPFAFFDATRTQKTLEILPHISDNIAQTWILAQSFDEENMLDLHLRCSRDREELVSP